MSIKNDLLVVKSNRLIEASYRLTLVEQQVVLYALCRTREEQKGLLADQPVTIHSADFAKQFGTEPGSVYGQLKEAMRTLFTRSVTIHDIHPETNKLRITETRWISDRAYIDGAGIIELTFAPKVIPYIMRLESEFTSYRLEKIGKMTSTHAVRLYELLVQYLNIGKREFEIAWLREVLQLNDAYSAIKDFKKNVIDLGINQINEHSDIRVQYTQRKTGRAVTHLIFEIKPEPKAKTEKPVKASKRVVINDAYLEKHARPGETWKQARDRLQQK